MSKARAFCTLLWSLCVIESCCDSCVQVLVLLASVDFSLIAELWIESSSPTSIVCHRATSFDTLPLRRHGHCLNASVQRLTE